MHHLLGFGVVLLVTAGCFALALLPAIREALAPTDAKALPRVGRDTGEPSETAERLRDFLSLSLPPRPSGSDGIDYVGSVGGRPPIVRLADGLQLPNALIGADGVVGPMIVAEGPLLIRGGETFIHEVIARGGLESGPDTAFRALLLEGPATLGRRTHVLRWLYSEFSVTIGDGSRLDGRVAAHGPIGLAANTTFTSIEAPCIFVAGDATIGDAEVSDLPPVPRRPTRRVEGTVELGAGERLDGPCIIEGALIGGADVEIHGDVKANGSVELGPAARVSGSLVAAGTVALGPHTAIAGPVVSEESITLAEHATAGSPGLLTSVVAPRITLGDGVRLFGLVHASELGATHSVRPSDRLGG
jgi:predicted acyltransferase (DUF342 family)